MASEDVISELHTDAACGLNRKAARSRSKKGGKNTLFDAPASKKQTLWKPLLREPSLWILLFVSVFAICFSQAFAGISALVCLLIGGFGIWHALHHQKLLESYLNDYRIPWVSVIRSGKCVRISARDIVKGDVILLKAGDVVPCDCRLLSLKDLTVYTLQPDLNGKAEWKEYEKNADFVYAYGSTENAPSFVNMLYGGSRIARGEAAAVAVALGEETFLGAMSTFEIPCEAQKNEKGSTASLRPFLRVYGILLMLLLLPLTVIGLLVLPKESSMIGFFVSLSAMLAIGAPALLELQFRLIAMRARRDSFYQKPSSNRAILKSARAIDCLASLSDVFVLGTCGISDGKLHLIRCATGKGELPAKEGESYFVLQPLCEAFLLLSQAMTTELEKELSFPEWDDTELCRELIDASAFDLEAMSVRVKHAALLSMDGKSALLEVQTKSGSYHVQFTEKSGLWNGCAAYENDGSLCAMEPSVATRLQQFYESARAEGCRVITAAKQINGRKLLLGVLAIRDVIQQTLPSVLEELKQSGVRVRFFLPNETAETLQYLSAAGLLEQTCLCSQSEKHGMALTKLIDNHRVLVGFSHKEILALIETMRKNGSRIALMGNAASDLPLMQRANLSIACDGTAYHKSVSVENEIDVAEDGLSQSAHCAQVLRRSADVLIPRAEKLGGGLFSLLQAIAHCRAARVRMRTLLPLLAASQLLCVLLIAFSACFGGVGFMNSLQILICGLLLPLAQTKLILELPIPQNKLRKWHSFDAATIEKTLFRMSFWIPTSVCAFGSVLYCFILSLCGLLTIESAISYVAVSCVILQAALILQSAIQMKLPLLHKGWLPLLFVLGSVAVLILLSTAFPTVFSILGFGAWTTLTVLSLPIPPILFFGTRFFLRLSTHRTSK